MANTYTNLVADAYAALDVVSRELVGFIPAVLRDTSVDQVALGQTIRSFKTRPNTAKRNITAAMAFPAAAYQTIDNVGITITNTDAYPFSWTGEEQRNLDAGPGHLSVQQDQIAQAMRSATNDIETVIGVAAAAGASRAYGTAGTTPFASTLGDPAQIRKILDDNGAPASERSLIIGTTAGAALRTLAQLTKANEAGTTDTLRNGALLDIHGMAIRESAQIANTTAGAMTGALFNGAGAVGDTTITFDTGTVNTTGIVAGDVLTIVDAASVSRKYVVATGTTSTSGTFTIAAPGLLSVVADNTAITVNATSARNVAFTRNAIILAARLPEVPKEGDLAIMRETITDPISGISFGLAVFPGYHMVTYELQICYGVKVLKPEHMAILLG